MGKGSSVSEKCLYTSYQEVNVCCLKLAGRFCFWEMTRTGKSVETENRIGLPGAGPENAG